MKKLNLKKLFIAPLAIIALVGMSDAALAHDNGKRDHRHADREYSGKYRHLDHNPKYRSIKKHSHKPYGIVTIRKQYSNWPKHYRHGHGPVHGYGHGYGHGKAKGLHKHHHKPVKYVYVPAYRHGHHKHGHGKTGYSLKYFGDNFSIGFREWY